MSLLFRRFYRNVKQWRVGLNAGTHSFCDKKSEILDASWEENDPYVKIVIPGADNAVYQIIGNPDVTGRIRVRDYNAVTQLLYHTDIQAAGGDQYAVTSTSRNVIDYFAIIINNVTVTVATETHIAGTTHFTFTNTRIGRIYKEHNTPASPWTVEFYADSVAQVDV